MSFERVPLTDVLEFREGPGIMAADFQDSGVPLIRLAGLKPRGSLLDGCNWLDPDKVAHKWSQFRIAPGDVLLSTSASLGEVAVADESATGAVPYTGIIRFRPRDERMLPKFIAHALTEYAFKAQIEAMGVGSVMRHFGPSHLRQMSVAVPPVPQQRAIAEVLGALDDKTAANAKLAATGERLAIATAATAAGQVAVGSIAVLSKRQIHPLSLGDTAVEHFSLPAFDADQMPALETATSIKSSKFVIDGPAVLVSKLNPRFPRIWHVGAIDVETPALASTEFLVLQSNVVSTEVLWALLADQSFSRSLEAKVSGTSGSHQRVKPTEVLAEAIGDPSTLTTLARTVIEASVQQAALARRESRTLAALRDALLSELMSGRLRVKDAERAVEEVL